MTRIVFISNFLNHHQVPLCNAFNQTPGVEFHFIASEEIPEERRKMGYSDFTGLAYHVSLQKNMDEAQKLIDEADAVIAGGEPSGILDHRLSQNRLTFRYSERLYKKGAWRRLNPKAYRFVNERFLKYRDNPGFYVLCSSAYLSKDQKCWHFPTKKCLKWGYFPDASQAVSSVHRNEVPEILFAARLLALKHPEMMISLAEYLKEKNIAAHITIAGDGEKRQMLEQDIKQKELEKIMSMKGMVPYQEVYQLMAGSDIFAFCSDIHEGWGAVVSEAMQLNCAVVSSAEAGSSRYLIQDGVNGYLYHWNDAETFIQKTVSLIQNEGLRTAMAGKAKDTMNGQWNAQEAVRRFLNFLDLSEEERKCAHSDGPMSVAAVMNEKDGF